MTRDQLITEIKTKRSFLCVGLDTDLEKIPVHLKSEEDPITAFNKEIIKATAPYAVAYKFNIAFYESQGPAGWESLERSLAAVPENCFTIADAKRGDIGNTSRQYAKTFFERYKFDSITVSPYMGHDSVQPFMEFDGKWTIILGLTSNPGSHDFERKELAEGGWLSEKVLNTTSTWGTPNDLMFVIGALDGELMRRHRKIAPDHFFLVPGVGAQGGDLNTVAECMMNSDCGLLVNSSRGIIYASSGEDYAQKSSEQSRTLQQQMERHLEQRGVI